jgi:biotin transport system ATP-binding protein
MIEVRHITFTHPGAKAATLDAVDLDAAPGEVLLLAGANGAGKSTLLCLLAGLFSPDAGSLRVADFRSPGEEAEIRDVAGLVLQDADAMLLGATGREDLELAGTPDAAAAMARRLGLAEVLDQPVQTLSWGQKRKLCLAGALLRQPKVLLLDEPFAGLDYPGVLEMRAVLRSNRKAGLTQVLATHDLEPALDLAARLVVLHHGQVALDGPPAEILDRVAEFGVRPPSAWRRERRVAAWDEA